MERMTSSNEKLAFIDHSFHQKSTATYFLIDLLKQYYDVTIFWDESWNGGPKVDIEDIASKEYNTVIIFQQTHFSEKELRKIAHKNLILFPMFDDSREFSNQFWDKFQHIKIINFSKTFHIRMKKRGLWTNYFQYFPPPLDLPEKESDDKNLSGFFWQRTDQITWNHIRGLIKNTEFNKFHLHAAMDPPGNYRLILPSNEERKKYHVTLSQWFPEKGGYLNHLNAANVFFAPRLYEGIGMSFLEAMSLGKCVVAPNNPTMNEYIVHGKTGLLFNPDKLAPLDFSQVAQIGKNARQYVVEGYNSWLRTQKKMMDCIRKEKQ